MNLALWDHGLAIVLVAIVPASALWTNRRSRQPGRAVALLREYQMTIALQWTLVGIALAWWFAAGRGRAALGLDHPRADAATLVGVATSAVIAGGLALQLTAVRRGGAAARAAVRAQLGGFQPYVPRSRSEVRWFHAVAVTAGVCEEVLYRGFLIAYLAVALGAWPAVVAGATLFGLAHLHLGRGHAIKATVVGLALGALYLACGTLLWSMIVHAAIDLYGGALSRLALDDSP